ncbi:uncharacterized protein Bfra_000908 [Botrytis fragariae]|uniref:Uncharacterized protein n=1 Tax=Botrytis fragariae TaxID=1964551 RepID=A0A8H6B3F6_9HELO|nr:uncharacterized protein Bfra_000908 [Botrytis fragariae]KAF5878741.1 hypothetical protein Bfra_000908 [Botrytis fragariae]
MLFKWWFMDTPGTCNDPRPLFANYTSTFISPYQRMTYGGYSGSIGQLDGMKRGNVTLLYCTNFNDEKISTIANSPSITPLSDFDWRTTEPLKLRPFKPVYHMTMGTKLPLNSAADSF